MEATTMAPTHIDWQEMALLQSRTPTVMQLTCASLDNPCPAVV
jgi:hypothetical protein